MSLYEGGYVYLYHLKNGTLNTIRTLIYTVCKHSHSQLPAGGLGQVTGSGLNVKSTSTLSTPTAELSPATAAPGNVERVPECSWTAECNPELTRNTGSVTELCKNSDRVSDVLASMGAEPAQLFTSKFLQLPEELEEEDESIEEWTRAELLPTTKRLLLMVMLLMSLLLI